MWFRDLEEAGIPRIRIRIRIHDSRHTYTSLFMMSGGDIYDLKMLLNHSTVAMTEKYAKLSPKHLAKVKDLITINIQTDDNVIPVCARKIQGQTTNSISTEVLLAENL